VVETKKPPVDGFVRRDLPGCVVCSTACPPSGPCRWAPLRAWSGAGEPGVLLCRLIEWLAVELCRALEERTTM